MKKSDIKIQILSSDYWEDYKNLRLKALQSEPQAFSSNYSREVKYPNDKWKQRLEESGKGRTWLLFAIDAKMTLVGMIGGYRDDEDVQNNSAQIWGVYVDKEMRGKGIGKELMNSILEVLRSVPNIKKIIIEVNADQKIAKKLYEGVGFKEFETHKQIMGDGIEHKISKMFLNIN